MAMGIEWNWAGQNNQNAMANQSFANNAANAEQQIAEQQQQQQQKIDSIRQRIAANNARIAQLKAQLAQMSNDDSLDKALAANRAKVGDMSGALSHLNRIDNRKSAMDERARQKRLENEDIIKQIRNLDAMYEYGGLTDPQIAANNADREYLMNKLAMNGGTYTNRTTLNNDDKTSTTDFKAFVAKNTDKAGRFTGKTAQEAIDNRNNAAQLALSAGGEEAAATAKKILNTKTTFEHASGVKAKKDAGKKAYNALNTTEKALADESGKFTASDGKTYSRNKNGEWLKD